MVNKCTFFIHQLLFPPTCTLCGAAARRDVDLCPACAADLPWTAHACSRCARPLPALAQGAMCGACLEHPPAFDGSIAALHYRRPVDELIRRLKFGRKLEYARLLGMLLAGRLRDRLDTPPHALLPVPLHPARQRQRGFNQAVELARPVSKALRIPIAAGICTRQRATEIQSLLDRRARRANLRGAFRLEGPVQGAHIAIIDDVMTTGSTAHALAQTLRAGGARRIDVWCVARADAS